jgi:hypothetical protein
LLYAFQVVPCSLIAPQFMYAEWKPFDAIVDGKTWSDRAYAEWDRLCGIPLMTQYGVPSNCNYTKPTISATTPAPTAAPTPDALTQGTTSPAANESCSKTKAYVGDAIVCGQNMAKQWGDTTPENRLVNYTLTLNRACAVSKCTDLGRGTVEGPSSDGYYDCNILNLTQLPKDCFEGEKYLQAEADFTTCLIDAAQKISEYKLTAVKAVMGDISNQAACNRVIACDKKTAAAYSTYEFGKLYCDWFFQSNIPTLDNNGPTKGHFNWVGQCNISAICVRFANAVASGSTSTPAPVAPGHSQGTIIGIALGVIAAVIVVLAVLVLVSRRKRFVNATAAATEGGGISL